LNLSYGRIQRSLRIQQDVESAEVWSEKVLVKNKAKVASIVSCKLRDEL